MMIIRSPLPLLLAAVLLTISAACSRGGPEPKQYELEGQILAIRPEANEVIVRHKDIKGFMPAMTMPYTVKDPALLQGKAAGDLITATLVVAETSAHLSTLTKTGHAELPVAPTEPEVSVFEMLKPGDTVPDVALVDETGMARPLSSYRGQPLALTFIYTRCPDPEFCPLMNQLFLAVQTAIQQTPALAKARLLTVSFDPEYDTPAVLKDQATRAKADPAVWHFATAPTEVMTPFAAKFGLTVTRNDTPILIHNLATAVIDGEGRLVSLHGNNKWTPPDLVAELRQAAAARPAATH